MDETAPVVVMRWFPDGPEYECSVCGSRLHAYTIMHHHLAAEHGLDLDAATDALRDATREYEGLPGRRLDLGGH